MGHRSTKMTASPVVSSHSSTEMTASSVVSHHRSTEMTVSPVVSRHRITEMTASPVASRHRSTEVTVSPVVSHHRSTERTASPVVSRHRSTEMTASPVVSRHRSKKMTQSTEGAHTAAITASRGDAISTTVDDLEVTGDREPASEEVDRYVLSGRINHLPERHPKMVRIFLSSTFTDMATERNALFKNTYPKLLAYCRTKWDMDFQVVDMRWGVPSGATNDHSGTKLCMAELKVCQEESLGPNFVLLLGHRYGARPVPLNIDDNEFRKLVDALKRIPASDDEIELLNTWYKCDENAEPSQRVLQPLDSCGIDLREYSDTVEPKLRRIIRAAADECLRSGLIDAASHHCYFRSVTEEEVYNGILTVQNPNDHCLCFVRKINNVNMDHEKAWRFVDKQDDGHVDQETQKLLESVRNNVYNVLARENIAEYSIPWSEKEGVNENDHKNYLEDLCNAFYTKLIALIDKAALSDKLQQKIIQSALLSEVAEHSYEAKSKCATASCHRAIKEQILEYIESDQCTPLVVYGESGSGKTSLMGMASASASLWVNGQSDIQVVRRFLGITTSSTYIESLLRSISDQVAAYWNIRPPVVDDPLNLLETLFNCLPRKARLVVFLDSLDRLSPVGKAHTVCWLPLNLPTNVKVVLSCLPSDYSILDTLRSRDYPDSSFACVENLDSDTSLYLLIGWLSSVQRTVTVEQRDIIASILGCSHQRTPLFVKLVFNIVRSTPSYVNGYTFADRVLNLDSSSNCIRLIFTELRAKHGPELVDTAFAFLQLSHQGLTENEIVDLLSLDDAVLNNVFQFHMPPMRRLPAVLWARIRHDLTEYIVERDIAGAKVLAWVDRTFSEVVHELVINQCPYDRILELQTIMVEYFMGSWAHGKLKPFKYTANMVKKLQLSSDVGEADRFVPAQPVILINGKRNMRRLTQLPRLLTAARMADAFFSEILGSIDILTGLFEVYTWSEIYEIIRNFLSMIPGQDQVTELALGMLITCLLLCSAQASVCPATLAPLLAGRLLPYYGATSVIDCLLDDIYHTGTSRNALVVQHKQLEGLGSYLLYELTNHHLGPCQRMWTISSNNYYYVMTVSKKATLIDMNHAVASMSFVPPLRPGDHFNILASSASIDSEYVAASLKDVPKVYVFSVKRRECTGNFDCRSVNGFQDFVIYDMLAFSCGSIEIAAVWGSSFHGILLYNLKQRELLYCFCDGRRVFTVVHSGTLLHVIQQGQVFQLQVKLRRSGTVKVTERRKQKLAIPSSLLVTAKHTSPDSKLVAFGTSDGKLFTWPTGSPFICRTVLDAAAHSLTIRDTEVIACTRNSIYGLIVNGGKSLPFVTWHIRRRFDWAGCLSVGPGIVGYRLGSISVLELTASEDRSQTNSRVEVYEYRTFTGHAKQITDIVLHKLTSYFMTCSADGTIKLFSPCRKVNADIADMERFDRMDVKINAIYGSGSYALSIAKDSKIVAVWSLSSGKIVHKLFHEGANDLKDAIVLGECVVTADAGGLVSVWNLKESSIVHPVSEVNIADFHTMVAKSETELIILAKESVTELCLPTGAIVLTKPLQIVGTIVCSCWCPGSIYFVDGFDHPSLNLISDKAYIHDRLQDGGCLAPFGSVVTGMHCSQSILAIAFAFDIVFYNVNSNHVLTSMSTKRPMLLKSHSSIVAAQSGLTVQFFDMDTGVTKMGSLKLSSAKDSATLSPDGLHCLVIRGLKMLHLYRISDLCEAGVYSCYSDVDCAVITSDSKHVLVGMSDTRLLSFIVADFKCQDHLNRVQGVLRKTASSEEQNHRKLMLSAAASPLGGMSDRVLQPTFVTASHSESSEDPVNESDATTKESEKSPLKPSNMNCIQFGKDTKEMKKRLLTYAESITSSVWKRHFPSAGLLRRAARTHAQ